jgi:hypothetical protein
MFLINYNKFLKCYYQAIDFIIWWGGLLATVRMVRVVHVAVLRLHTHSAEIDAYVVCVFVLSLFCNDIACGIICRYFYIR